MDHENFMLEALKLAEDAARHGEVPVGCVIVNEQGAVIGRGRNQMEEEKNATSHAEIKAVCDACSNIRDWRLDKCSLYVTLEPCPMCAGAIINSRIKKIFYGAKDEKTGSCGSVVNIFMENFGHEPEIVGGILEEKCAGLLTEFFGKLRKL